MAATRLRSARASLFSTVGTNVTSVQLMLLVLLTSTSLGFREVSASSSRLLDDEAAARSAPQRQQLSRTRRAVNEVIIGEDATPDLTLFDLNDETDAKPLTAYDFVVVSATGVSSSIFRITNDYKLKLNPNVPTAELQQFDREMVTSVEVNIEATKRDNPNAGQKVMITVKITLSDVNDEPPAIINPTPYQGVVSENAPPGTLVYTVSAVDPDEGSRLEFTLEGSNPRFDTRQGSNPNTIEIVTIGTDPFDPNSSPLTIGVSVQDSSASTEQRTFITIEVTVGTLAPQFYQTSYEGRIYENSPQQVVQVTDGSASLVIQVIQFQPNNGLRFEVSDSAFEIDSSQVDPNQIMLRTRQEFNFETVQSVTVTVTVTESVTNYQSTATVKINVIDENDSTPKFVGTTQYFVQVREDTPAGGSVFSVSATDDDSGPNGEIIFSVVGTDVFVVETVPPQGSSKLYIGNVKVASPSMLDFEAGRKIDFSIMATDGYSATPRSSTVLASVTIMNVNDNDPTINIDNSTKVTVPSSAQIGYVVTILAASDLDGDNINFFFEGRTANSGIFTIEQQSGKLSLRAPVPEQLDKFDLQVITEDDGSCCGDSSDRRTSTTTVTVNVEDANLNKPNFVQCNEYNKAEVMENAPIGTSVVTVSAQDLDRGMNNKVTYRLDTNSNTPPFQIDPENGLITVRLSDQIVRERGRDSYIQVTVIGENSESTLQLQGFCTFRVNIVDINDHPPTFDKSTYDFAFLLSSGLPATITRMVATDGDFGENANITYSLSNAPEFFSINALTGAILLQADDRIEATTYTFTVIANDNGKNPSASTGSTTVRVVVTAGDFILPSWLNPPSQNSMTLNFPEDTTVDSVLTTLQCQSNDPDKPEVEFRVFDTTKTINDNSEFFMAREVPPGPGSAVYGLEILLKKELDYTEQSEHLVTATCQGFSGSNLRAPDIVIRVRVDDTNNQGPIFKGMSAITGRYAASVPENAPTGTTVRTVSVVDDDENQAFKQISFSLRKQDAALFRIAKTGDFTAAVTTAASFDRETQALYNFEVVASDGVNTDDRVMEVEVTDANDLTPVFAQSSYEFDVSETAEINHQIGEVTASDEDTVDQTGLEYQFTEGNYNNAFNILFGTGQIRLVRKLDFESTSEPRTYNMRLVAYDNERLHTATTSVTIHILDANDNPPKFVDESYTVVDTVDEEDSSITPSNPRFLVQVEATDEDKDRTQTKITYDLAAASTLFRVDPDSGNVYLIGKLDRDGPVPDTRVTIRAADEPNDPLYAYADVAVFPRDINDNAPQFDQERISFSVKEHEPDGSIVGTVLARDIDEGENARVQYRLATQQPDPESNYFRITEAGTLHTNVAPALLNYENFTSTQIMVEAYDQGQNSRSTAQAITVNLVDINDQKPYFDKDLYTERMSEAQTSGEILRVLARDADTAPKNRDLQFTIIPSNMSHFLVSRSEDYAVISVNPVVNPDDRIDYERDPHVFTFTLQVTDDPGDPDHTSSTQIQITVEDYNDNAPTFNPNEISKSLKEGERKGAVIATFTATDRDSGINAEFEYSVDGASDPYYEFYIDPYTGNVTTRKVLDRELADTRTVIILAIDKGENPLTGEATLKLTLEDINDNAPTFAEDYQPVVPEEEDNNNRVVVEIFAKDPDTTKYGPPFGFALPQGCSEPACRDFTLQYNRARDGGNGTATIRTSKNFDREDQKKYYLPIVIWDMNDGSINPESQTGTSTLTITIGDKNDNEHGPGHQEIIFHNFDGRFGDVAIGRVYAEDADDWDLPDKTFTYISPELYKSYFSVDPETGIITIKKGVPVTPEDEPYEFKVDVYDKVFKNTAACTVAVHVSDLPDEALKKAGTVRLTGITSEEFIAAGGPSVPGAEVAPSKMLKFKAEMARLLQYPGPDNIEVVSLNDGRGYLDVRFSGHASPYVTPSQMESALLLNSATVQNGAGIQVGMVPLNLCMEEIYSIGCYVDLQESAEPKVIDANGTSLTTVGVAAEAKDGCPDTSFPEPVACRGDYCFNGGTCVQDDWGKLSCQCLSGFDGPRCQQRRHSFDGNSIAFYQGLSPCVSGRTSIEFITTEADGLIMYQGPVIDIDPDNSPQDFLLLELKNGYPQLRLNLGVGEVTLALYGTDSQGAVLMPALNDGQWHRLDIDRDHQEVTLTVDHCKYAVADANGTVADWTPCHTQGRVPGGDVLLNVQSLLQLGGRYPRNSPPAFPTGVPTKGFTGCLKNLFHNSKLYDLYYRPILNWNSGRNGCPREERICGEGGSSPVCGVRASCQSRWRDQEAVQDCTCHPGWYGDRCTNAAPTMDFKDDSFFQWQLSTDQLSDAERAASVQLMFRSRQLTGTLFALTNAAQHKMDLQLEGGRLVLRYNLGQGERLLVLDRAAAADGTWHVARMERHGSEFQLTLDGGEGRTYAYRPLVEDTDVLFKALPYISSGARVPTVDSATLDPSQISNDLVDTCVRDIRINDQWLPMETGQNDQANTGISLLRAPNILPGCTRDDCAGVTCSNDRQCYALWGAYECRCLPGSQPDVNDQCVSSCIPNPCFNNVPCSIVSSEVTCQCPADFTGQYCNIGRASDDGDDGLSSGAIAGIVIAIIVALVLLILLILFLITCRRHDSEKDVLEVDPDDDFIRENVMFYDEEGAGEEDHEAYDITLLQKMNSETPNMPHMNLPKEDDMTRRNEPRLDRPDVGSFIDSRIRDTENDDDPFKDVPLEFNFEGGNSDAGSLSSLNTSSSGGSQDYDYLNDWGPKFARLADMYGAGQNLES